MRSRLEATLVLSLAGRERGEGEEREGPERDRLVAALTLSPARRGTRRRREE